MSNEHPVEQPIISVTVSRTDGDEVVHHLGYWGVTRIEATTKSGMYSNIPYIRVWAGGIAVAEYCQHNILEVNFKEKET